MIVLIIATFILFASYFYVESTIYAMQRKRWLVAGLLLGPMLLPMFQISKHVAMRKAAGFDNQYIIA